MREAFPDLNVTVDKMVADDDNVAIAYTITGTRKGDFMVVSANESASKRTRRPHRSIRERSNRRTVGKLRPTRHFAADRRDCGGVMAVEFEARL